MNDVLLTVTGNVVSDPQERTFENGNVLCTFRIAVNPRKFDRTSARWVDGESMFMSVITWRGLAENVAKSFSKGDPIIVSGKLKVRRWDSGERQGTSVEIEAVSLGHDLSRGTSSFTRVKRSISAEELHVDEQSDSVVDSWLAEGSSSNAA
ncbi:MAG: hypothetical protein GM45_5700 [actinobacterium acAMD-5]|jgi:single-strand DNA-binding protein|nr:MAG: hypothetical protein GM45_5700 [actinobacterium acAMD-5]